MKIIIAGGTGLIGRALTKSLVNEGHTVIVLSRHPASAEKQFSGNVYCLLWADEDFSPWISELKDTDIFINLVGENIGKGRWTDKLKRKIRSSRVDAGRAISQAIFEAGAKPKLLVQASATGYYGNANEKELDESAPPGIGFLAEVCAAWEDSTKAIEKDGIKRSILRIGPVLSAEGGALKKMLLPFKLFVGGPPGNGKQIFPWIHIDDVLSAIQFIIDNRLDGVFNLVAPNPVAMKEFARVLGKALRRPGFMPIPALVLKLIFGEMARETILAGQKVIPKALAENGFKFQFHQLEPALQSFFQKDVQ